MHHPPTPPTHMPRAAYRVAEVAEMTGLSTDQIYRMVRRGEIGSKKSGRSVVIPVAAFNAWLHTDERASA